MNVTLRVKTQTVLYAATFDGNKRMGKSFALEHHKCGQVCCIGRVNNEDGGAQRLAFY